MGGGLVLLYRGDLSKKAAKQNGLGGIFICFFLFFGSPGKGGNETLGSGDFLLHSFGEHVVVAGRKMLFESSVFSKPPTCPLKILDYSSSMTDNTLLF